MSAPRKFEFDTSSFEPIQENEQAFAPNNFEEIPEEKPLNIKEISSKYGVNFPKTPAEQAEMVRQVRQGLTGAGQAFVNYPIKVANLFRKNAIPEYNFAPETEEAKRGALAGDIASFFLPGGAAKMGIEGLKFLPKIGEGVNAITKAVEANPFLKGLSQVGRTAGEAGLYGAAHQPENAMEAGLTGAGIGGGLQTATNLLMTQNPVIRALATAGLGAGLGQLAGGHPLIGAAAAGMLPKALRMLGIGPSQNVLAKESLEGIEPADIKNAIEANQRLGTTVTPGQASGNYVLAGNEGALKRSPEGAQYALTQEEKQLDEQRQTINNMLDNIYIPTAQNEAKIQAAYGQANKVDLNPFAVEKLKENPIVASAFKTVKSIPAYSNVPENNYKFLAEVDRQLFRDLKAAEGNKPNVAYAINQVKNHFNNYLKTNNPAYEQATTLAQPKLVRENIENKFNKMEEDITGKNFYSKFLNSKSAYEDVIGQTKNFPQAQQAIKDMRQAWKYLSNIKTPSQAEAQSKTGLSQARDQFKAMFEAMQRYVGAKNDVKGLKYIYSPGWEKDVDRIASIKDRNARNKEMASFIGKMGLAYGLE